MPGGPLAGVRVVELSHEHVAFAGKLLADLGAEVTVVEPPGGSAQRAFGPFLDDEPGPERSLWWWHYNTSKRSVVADLAAWGLWPTVQHTKHGPLRADGQPVHLSATDWRIRRGGPVLGEDNERVLTEVLGLTTAEIGRLAAEGVI